MLLPIAILNIADESDRAFLTGVYQKYYPVMYRQAMDILGDAHKAEDVMQTVCLRLIEQMETIRSMAPPLLISYILTTTKHTAYKYNNRRYERDRRSTPSLDSADWPDIADDSVGIQEEVIFQMTILDLKRALQKLPQKYQDILEYKYILDLTDKEIAAALGIGKDSVRTYLMRARKAAYAAAKEAGL